MEEFLREIEEDMHMEKYRVLWRRYGKAAVALATFAIVMSAGLQGYKSYKQGRNARATDALVSGDFEKAVSFGGNAKAIALLRKQEFAGAEKAAHDDSLRALAQLHQGRSSTKVFIPQTLEREAYAAAEAGDAERAKSKLSQLIALEDVPQTQRARAEAARGLLSAHPDALKVNK
jgi:hypothetical protein